MELNQAVAQKGWIPNEVELTVQSQKRFGGRKVEIRSRHLMNWRLSSTDRKRIAKAGDQMANFQAVSFEAYRRQTPETESRRK